MSIKPVKIPGVGMRNVKMLRYLFLEMFGLSLTALFCEEKEETEQGR